jgi:diguanylate cyclase (GGDEF)-like protein
VQHAVSLLGIRGTRNLALGMCVMELTPGGPDGAKLLEICLRRAAIARGLAEQLVRPNPEDYFTLGLLLEIGLLVKARTNLASAVEIAASAAHARITMERAAGQEDHAKLGGRLARSWQLGDEISKALLFHHSRTAADTPFGTVAWLTEIMAGVVEAATSLGIPTKVVDEVLQQTPTRVGEAAQQFGRDIGPQPSVESLLYNTQETIGELNRNYSEVVHKLESLLKEKEQLALALLKADQKLAGLALTDDVCGLPNARAFREALVRDLARADRSKTHIALVLVELDNFRRVSEKAGPAAADKLLSGSAEILQSCVRTSDVLARVGPETFAMLLPSTSLQGAIVVADRACSRLAQRYAGEPEPLRLTASVGVAATMGPQCRDQADALLSAAENGLAMAKNAGRNRVMVGSL